MEKLQLSNILIQNAQLYATLLDEKNEEVINFIKITIEKQKNILKLKNIDQDNLKLVVQL